MKPMKTSHLKTTITLIAIAASTLFFSCSFPAQFKDSLN